LLVLVIARKQEPKFLVCWSSTNPIQSSRVTDAPLSDCAATEKAKVVHEKKERKEIAKENKV
jgi:hypothetical protein